MLIVDEIANTFLLIGLLLVSVATAALTPAWLVARWLFFFARDCVATPTADSGRFDVAFVQILGREIERDRELSVRLGTGARAVIAVGVRPIIHAWRLSADPQWLDLAAEIDARATARYKRRPFSTRERAVIAIRRLLRRPPLRSYPGDLAILGH